MNIGKVYKYDGVVGQIITDNKNYTFSYNGLEDNVKDGDIVSFKIRNSDSDVVTDVRKYTNKDLKTLLKEYKEKKD